MMEGLIMDNNSMIPIAHYENRYLISPRGFIRNLADNSVLKPSFNPNGYLKVGLANGDSSHGQFLLHILVAKHFIPNPYDYPQVNHKNGIKSECDKDNLEWMTSKQNIEHAFRTGLRPGYMSADDKETYLQRVFDGEMVGEIARAIGRRPETLHKMLRETADRLNKRDAWDSVMKENRRAAAIRNLESINS